MASKITHPREWQLAIGSLHRVDSFPNKQGGEQIILTFSMNKNSVTQFATVTCNDIGHNAWEIVYMCAEKLPLPDYQEVDREGRSSYLKTSLKKCLKTKMRIFLQKDKQHWKTVGVGKVGVGVGVGVLDSAWIFFDRQHSPEEMMAHIREEHLQMIPNLAKKEYKIKKI